MNLNGRKVIVQDGNVDKALRKFKKKISEDGLLMELHERQFYTKPTIKRKIAKAQAVRRWKKWLAGQELPKKMF